MANDYKDKEKALGFHIPEWVKRWQSRNVASRPRHHNDKKPTGEKKAKSPKKKAAAKPKKVKTPKNPAAAKKPAAGLLGGNLLREDLGHLPEDLGLGVLALLLLGLKAAKKAAAKKAEKMVSRVQGND